MSSNVIFQRLVHRCSVRLEAFLNKGTDLATRDDAAMMRRGRAFGLIAFVLLFAGALLIGPVPSLRGLLLPLLLAMATISISCWASAQQGGRFARLAAHLTLGLTLAALTVGAVRIGSGTNINVTIPSLLVLIASHILGVRAAAWWTVACLASLAFAVFLPDPPAGAPPENLTVRFMARGFVLLGILWIAVAARRVEDRQAEEIDFLARHDTLTGLLSRWEFERRLSDALARCRRYERSLALIYIDLDRFKDVNDSLGHFAGDVVLKTAGERIAAMTRQTDAAARLGGDEFLVLLDDLPGAAAAELSADRLVASLSQPVDVEGQQVQLSASAGIALYPTDAVESEALTRAADRAMYASKRERGNAVRFYSTIAVGS